MWTHTLEVTHDNSVAENNLGTALLKQTRVEEAIPHFRAAVAINPTDPNSNLNIGTYEQMHGNLPAAIERYQAAANYARNPKTKAKAYNNLGYAYKAAGDLASAKHALQQAVEADPEFVGAWISLGLFAQRSGDMQLAISAYSQAMKVHSSDFGYLLLAGALEQSGDKTQAESARAQAGVAFQEYRGGAALCGRTSVSLVPDRSCEAHHNATSHRSHIMPRKGSPMSSAVVSHSPTEQARIAPRTSLPFGQAVALSLVLLIASSLLYLPIVHHPFANIDDQGYVYENLHVQDGLTWPMFKWAARSIEDSNWHPLTWISHALDCQLFGIDPAGHHAMNIVFHAVNGVVLFWVLLLATGWVGRSFMVAALFALHPINVESVAWAAERKTVLSTLFFLLALGAYRWYARQPGVMRYSVVAGLFGLGLMAKPQIITLPCVLLLWDYWPLRRMFSDAPTASTEADPGSPFPPKSFWWLVKEKIPLFVICAASALLTIKAQHVAHPGEWQYSLPVRAGNSIVAYVRYIGKALWPSKLCIIYLHPGNSLRLWQVAAAAAVLLAITALVIVNRQRRYLPVGWFWFLGTMVPTIGIIQVGRQAFADRYAYQSFLGLFILLCWGVADWARQRHLPKALLPGVSIAVLIALSVMTHRQVGYWKDNLTLWSRALQVTNNNWLAEDMVGGILLNQGHRAEAIPHYRAAVAANPTDAGANLAIAIYEQDQHNLPEAIRRYRLAIREMDDPLEQAKAYQNLAVAYRDLGDRAEYEECLRKSARLRKQ